MNSSRFNSTFKSFRSKYKLKKNYISSVFCMTNLTPSVKTKDFYDGTMDKITFLVEATNNMSIGGGNNITPKPNSATYKIRPAWQDKTPTINHTSSRYNTCLNDEIMRKTINQMRKFSIRRQSASCAVSKEHVKKAHFQELWCPLRWCNYSTPDLSTLDEHFKNDHGLPHGMQTTKKQLKAKYNYQGNTTRKNESLDKLVYAIFPDLVKQWQFCKDRVLLLCDYILTLPKTKTSIK
uniref:C2H2-type domain-containing protein n=1 Tax=Heterorhabditis bacteriophora TaxID=37862 RepID=A0A1I7W6R7_HETBA